MGRGATKQPLSAVASSNPDAFHLDPPLYYAPTLQRKKVDPTSIRVKVPFYSPPPPIPKFLPPTKQQEPPKSETEAYMAMPVEGQEEYKEALASLRLSEKIHVLGFTAEAKFILHGLAGTPDLPPPQLLTRERGIDRWGAEGRQVSLRGKNGLVTSYDILMPEFAGPTKVSLRQSLQPRLKPIDNLIISTSENAVIPALLNIRDRINENTTICLLTTGLGLAERLSKDIFPDPATRPTFVLGHLSHKLRRDGRSQTDKFSVQVRSEGKLFLSGIPLTQPDGSEVNTWDRIVRHARTQHLVKVLSQVPGLHATSRPFSKFLRQKLPEMIFSSLADSVSVALGCRYDRIYSNEAASRMWRKLWSETIDIIAALPELENAPEVVEYFQGHKFATEMDRLLRAQHGASHWIGPLREGRGPPIQYLNGYFVKRAVELGLDCGHNRMVLNMVKAKLFAKQEELRSAIPLYYSPYTVGEDNIMNDEEPPLRPNVRTVYVDKPSRM